MKPILIVDDEAPIRALIRLTLERAGYTVDDHLLTSREEVEAFKAKHGIATTPLIFIGDEKIGGSDDLERYLAAQPAG